MYIHRECLIKHTLLVACCAAVRRTGRSVSENALSLCWWKEQNAACVLICIFKKQSVCTCAYLYAQVGPPTHAHACSVYRCVGCVQEETQGAVFSQNGFLQECCGFFIVCSIFLEKKINKNFACILLSFSGNWMKKMRWLLSPNFLYIYFY